MIRFLKFSELRGIQIMKTKLWLLLITLLPIYSINQPGCTITIKSEWKNLETARETTFFGNQWIEIALIKFKQISKENVFINQLQFHWHGHHIHKLHASLYLKTNQPNFIPTEENLICDGQWGTKSQSLFFNFPDLKLGPNTTFVIVATIDNQLETTLHNGSFTLADSSLPEELQNISNRHISFSLPPQKEVYIS